jgi:hypothetical protein
MDIFSEIDGYGSFHDLARRVGVLLRPAKIYEKNLPWTGSGAGLLELTVEPLWLFCQIETARFFSGWRHYYLRARQQPLFVPGKEAFSHYEFPQAFIERVMWHPAEKRVAKEVLPDDVFQALQRLDPCPGLVCEIELRVCAEHIVSNSWPAAGPDWPEPPDAPVFARPH